MNKVITKHFPLSFLLFLLSLVTRSDTLSFLSFLCLMFVFTPTSVINVFFLTFCIIPIPLCIYAQAVSSLIGLYTAIV